MIERMDGNSSKNDDQKLLREQALFAAALDRAAEKRTAFLDGACHGEPALRQRLEALLAAHEQPAPELGDDSETTVKNNEGIRDLDEAVGQTIGRYKLLEQIGEGGCGVVYVAEQTEPVRRRVALKVIKLGMDTKQVVARFEAERQALAMMDHPNIAKVLDAGTTEPSHGVPPSGGPDRLKPGLQAIPAGRPFFVMELVRGIPVTHYCDQANLSTRERLDLFIKVCHAIQHAHQKGIIHRDIKPSNILVTLHDGVPVPKVIDFGIAKATEGRLTDNTVYTQLHQFIGTPAYMSPEQAEMSGLDVDTRSDIYALGVLLYELLTGAPPFDGKELMSMGIDAMRKTIREKEPARPSTKLATLQGEDLTTTARRRSVDTSNLIHQLKGDLDWIVMKCLEKDRQRRYDTANGLAADLLRHLNDEPVLARPPSAAYKFQKAWRRNKVVYITGAVVVVLLIAGVVGTSFGLLRAERERKSAVSAQAGEAEQRILADQKTEEAKTAESLAKDNARQSDEHLYFSLVAQAYREVEANRPAHALKLLNDCPKDLRDWEWRHVWTRCYSTSQQSVTIPGSVQSIAVSPNGRDLAMKVDGVLELWKVAPTGAVQTKTVLRTIPADYTSAYTVSFSPDGTQLAAAMNDFTVTLWNVAKGSKLDTFEGHTNKVLAVSFHPNGREIASAGQGNAIRIWDPTTGTEIRTLRLDGEAPRIQGLAYSPDGRWVAAILWGNVVKVVDSRTGREQYELSRHSAPISAVAFSPDSQVLASTDIATIRLWDVATGMARGALEGHKSWITSVAFSPEGTRLASGGFDRKVKLWDWKKQREALSLAGHSNAVFTVAFIPDGKLISGDTDGAVRAWNISRVNPESSGEIGTLTGHTNRVWSLAFAPDGRLFSCAEDPRGIVWDLKSRQSTKTFPSIFDVAVSTDGRYVVSARNSNNLGQVQILDAHSLDSIESEFDAFEDNELFCATLSPDGKHLVAGGVVSDEIGRMNLLAWDWRESDQPRIVGAHDSWILDVAFSPDGRHLASASEDGLVQVWDGTWLSEPQTGRILWPASSRRELLKIAFSPDSKRLATGDGFNDVVVLDVETGALALRLQGHGDIVVCVAFSPDGKFIASAGADDTVRLWDARTGKLLHTYLGHAGIINAVAFSPDSRVLASGGQDNVIKLWRVESPRP